MMQTNRTTTSRWKKRAAILTAAAALAAFVPAVATTSVSAQTGTSVGAGGEFFPVGPVRFLDTRNPANDVAPLGAKPTDADGETFRLKVTDRGGVPADNVLAVAVSVIAISPDGPGYLSVRPAGFVPSGGADVTSLVNFGAFEVVPNLGIVGVGANGEIEIDVVTPTVNGDIHVVVDVYGWVATSGHVDTADIGSRVVSITPDRFMDTRNPSQLPPALTSPRQLGAGETVKLPIRGQKGVPGGDDITGVIVNLTGVEPSAATFLSLTPNGFDPDNPTSTGNYQPGEVRATLAVVPIGDDGTISVTNGPGAVHGVVDVLGYLQRGVSDTLDAGRLVPLQAPFRSFDTRLAEFGSVRLGPGQWEDWSFTKFSQSVELGGVTNIAQQGFFANLVGFELQNANGTFLTMNPRETTPFGTPPGNSNLNLAPSQGAVSNMALIRYGDNGAGDSAVVSAFNAAGSVHYHLDVYAVILAD